MKTGIYENIPADEYHAMPGLSCSGLKNFAVSPSYYQTMKEARFKRDPEQILIHEILQDPKLFEASVMVVGDKRTKKGKEASEIAIAENREPISQEQYDRFNLIRHSVVTHPEAKTLLQSGKAEASLFWEHPEYGFECRGRADFMTDGFIVDYKCVGATLSNEVDLSWLIYRMAWHLQAHFYTGGYRAITGNEADFVHVLIDHRAGWRVRHPIELRTVAMSSMDKARQDYDSHLYRYKECLENNDWSGIEETFLPPQVTQ